MGRLLFAVAMALFGVQHLLHAASLPGPTPGPPWVVGAGVVALAMCGGSLVVARSLRRE